MKRKIIIITFLFITQAINSQSSSLCHDGGFENLSLQNSGWTLTGYSRQSYVSLPNLLMIPQSINFNFSNSNKATFLINSLPSTLEIEIVSAGTDAVANIPKSISGKSLKIGGLNQGNYGVESLKKTVTISNANKFVSFWFAIIFNQGHGASTDGPFFGVRINGSFVSLNTPYNGATNTLHAINDNCNLFEGNKRNWSKAVVDLSAYVGQTIEFEFINGDCHAGNPCHTYTYIDNIECHSDIPDFHDCPSCKTDFIYSASKFGYSKSLPTLVAQNARYNEIDFCSFEENQFSLSNQINIDAQYDGLFPNNFIENQTATPIHVSSNFSHTGSKSLVVLSGEFSINTPRVQRGNNENMALSLNGTSLQLNTSLSHIPNFSYELNKSYKISGWIYSSSQNLSIIDNSIVQFEIKDGTNIIKDYSNATVKTQKIEGWQLFEMIVDIPKTNITNFVLKLKSNGNANSIRYFDDIKITPLEAQSKSYVYDRTSLRLINELDENHFATFYDYDDAGNLVRVRKETERGIVTIKETNFNYQRK